MIKNHKENTLGFANFSLGEVNWFGGFNKKTGVNNVYGFIFYPKGDIFFHKNQCLCALEKLIPGTRVVFIESKGNDSKPIAVSVRILSDLTDVEVVDLIMNSEQLSKEDLLKVVIFRGKIYPCEEKVLEAVSLLSASTPESKILREFWSRFAPVTPKDPFYYHAPKFYKIDVCKQYYSSLIDSIKKLSSSMDKAVTSIDSKRIYRDLDEKDERIAAVWAGRIDAFDAVKAKMLSARAAEKAAIHFYESVGLSVEDVSIKQLEGGDADWKTHDLIINSSESIDVKNSRRPVNGKNIYVEHTVPRFKLDRSNADVRIAGILSPYLSLEFIKNPNSAHFDIDKLIFLGETGQDQINRLRFLFQSETFEVARINDRMLPHWLFDYPRAWYKEFSDNLSEFANKCEWPEDVDWRYILNEEAMAAVIPIFCLAEKELPSQMKLKLPLWQQEFYQKMQTFIAGVPNLPVIFFAVLTDFLEKLRNGCLDFDPMGYKSILYFDSNPLRNSTFYPLFAIDPLKLVQELINVLANLWEHRDKADLGTLHNFRFIGSGILQGRRRGQTKWNTIVAYCGGTVYDKDDDGNVRLDLKGKPRGEKGKCGFHPLIIGDSSSCIKCGKLICGKCGFCSKPCQDQQFLNMVSTKNSPQKMRESNKVSKSDQKSNEPPRWEDIPDEAYYYDFSWRRH